MKKKQNRKTRTARFEFLEDRTLMSSYFVSPTGSDSAAGTSAAPWKTLQKAADTAQAGDLVTVRAGNYAGFIMGWDFHQNGTAANPITFKADPGAVINSKNAFTADGIDIESNNYIIIDGFKIDDTSGSITRAGIRAVGNSNVTIRNNFIEGGHHANWGIFTGFSINLLIENNTAINSGGQHGIYVSNSDNPNDNDIVRGNICYGNAQNGIQFNGDLTSGGDGELTGCIIENNIVHDNGWKGLSLISFSNGIVRNNLIYNNHTNGSGAAGIHLVAQPDTGMPSSNNLIENNTIIEPGMAAVRITDGSGNVFFNNLMVNPSSQYIVDESGSGNSIDSASNLGRTSTSGLFVSSSDYHLSSSHAAVNAGKASYSSKNAPTTDLEGNARPVGGSYDVGAYEFGSSSGGGGDTTPPTVSGVGSSSVTTTGATIAWTTNEAANTQVEYGTSTSYGSSSTLNSSMVTSHSVNLTSLNASTTYHYRVKSTDAAGNPTVSGDFTFTTAAPADTTPPTVSTVAAGSITASGATVTWTTNEASDTQVEYGTSTSYGSSTALSATMVTSHSRGLTGLAASTTYHYRVKSKDAAGNLTVSGDFTFTTAAPPDSTAPTISSVVSGSLTISSATIGWNTNEASNTQVEYGTSTSYGSSTTLVTSLVTTHNVPLSGLAANTTYHYRVKSRDAAGNLATSSDFTFTTPAIPDTAAPTVSLVVAGNISASAATITWSTDEASNTQVDFGLDTGYGTSTTLKAAMVTSHSAVVSGLLADTTYHFQVKSADAAGNLATVGDFTFTTASASTPDTTAPIATLSASDITTAGGSTYAFTVTYTDETAMNPDSIDHGDILVTGPNGFSQTAQLVSFGGSDSQIVAHYTINAPSGGWNFGANGDYTASIQAGAVTDTSNNAVAAGVLGTFSVNIVPQDLAGNSIAQARLGSIKDGQVKAVEDFVGPSDTDDFNRIDVSSAMHLNVKLQYLTANADVELLDADGQRVAISERAGTTGEVLSLDLSAGTYYLHVTSGDTQTTGYRLRVEGVALAVGTTDPLANAQDLGGISTGGVRAVTGTIGTTDRNNHYKFEVTKTTTVYIKLYNMTDDADLMLLDSNMQRIAYSKRTGSSQDAFTVTLQPGTYDIRVMFTKGISSTDYRLRLAGV